MLCPFHLFRYPLAGIDIANKTVHLGPGGWQVGDARGVGGYYIEGIVEELDAPWGKALDSSRCVNVSIQHAWGVPSMYG